MATAGGEGKVKVMSAEEETFGQELMALDATGNFGSAVKYVSTRIRLSAHSGCSSTASLTNQSKSGKLLAVASDTGYVTVFDSETGQLVSTFPGVTVYLQRLTTCPSADERLNLHSTLFTDSIHLLHV